MATAIASPGQAVPMGHLESGVRPSMTAAELHEISEYEKLVRFRDAVLAGSHPRVRTAHLLGAKLGSNGPPPSSPSAPARRLPLSSSLDAQLPPTARDATPSTKQAVDQESFPIGANAPQTAPATLGTVPGLGLFNTMAKNMPSGGTSLSGHEASKPLRAGKVEINPIFLEKSEDLVRAEIRLQRQRLERTLKDQIDQRRASVKTNLQVPELLGDFDVSDVLAKALVLAQKPAQLPDDLAADNRPSSGSLDDDTFYSSRHDTPDSRQELRMRSEPKDDVMRDASPYEPFLTPDELVIPTTRPGVAEYLHGHAANNQEVAMPRGLAPVTALSRDAHLEQSSSADALYSSSAMPMPLADSVSDSRQQTQSRRTGFETSDQESGETTQSSNLGTGRVGNDAFLSSQRRPPQLNGQLLEEAFRRQPSPLLRAHNLSPVAPQPAHVSPLAVARQPPIIPDDPIVRRATPAQVAHLRKEASGGSSPDSSPQGNKNSEKRKAKKKNKRKADRLTMDTATDAYIKTEPRSPSPLNAAPYERSSKRLRQSRQQPQATALGEARYDDGMRVEDDGSIIYLSEPQRYEPPARAYRSRESQHVRVAAPPTLQSDTDLHAGPYYIDRRRPFAPVSAQEVQSPYPGPMSYGGSEIRPVRPASQVAGERPQHEPPVYYRDVRDAPYIVTRSATDIRRSQSPIIYQRQPSVMGPPRQPQTRTVLDEFGREYLEPAPPATIIRDSAAPELRTGRAEYYYERPATVRPTSRHTDVFEEERIVYQSTRPTYGQGRRVITAPEAGVAAYSQQRSHNFPPRTAAVPIDEYSHSGDAFDARLIADPPRQYEARSMSVRPAVTSGQETARDHGRARLEGPVREYTRPASVRPPDQMRFQNQPEFGARLGDISQAGYPRAASARPTEVVHLEPTFRDLGRYQSARPEMPLRREYAASVQPMTNVPVMAEYAARPLDGSQGLRREHSVRPPGEYYDHAASQAHGQVVYMGNIPRDDDYF